MPGWMFTLVTWPSPYYSYLSHAGSVGRAGYPLANLLVALW